MTAMLQIMTYMLTHLEYTESEVAALFESLEAGEITSQDLLDGLGIEDYFLSPLHRELFQQKLRLWPSALAVVKIRENIA